MKGVRWNNLYYLKGSTIISQVETSIFQMMFGQVWQMRVGHEGKKSLQAPAKKGSLEGASTRNMKLGEHGVLDKKKVKFSYKIIFMFIHKWYQHLFCHLHVV